MTTTTQLEDRKSRWIRDALIGLLIDIGDVQQPMNIADIALLTARHFRVRREDLRSNSSWWIDVCAKLVAMALAMRLTKHSSVMISQYFNRSHSNVLRGIISYDAIIDEVAAKGAITIPPPRPLAPTAQERQRRTLKALAKLSSDGTFTAPEDVLPHCTPQAAANTLCRFVQRGHGEKLTKDNSSYFRITDAGCEFLATHNLHLPQPQLAEAA